jgi:hypothetical protein
MRTILVAFLAAGAAFAPAAGRQTSPPPAPETVLAKLEKAHPRLILREKDLAALKPVLDADALAKSIQQSVLRSADGMVGKGVVQYEKIGPRLLQVSRDCMNRVYTLALAWRLTQKPAYLKKAEEELLAVCAFKDWNPSHFLDTAEMSHAVGIGYDWLYPALSPESREKIRDGLIRLGLKPGMECYGAKKAWWVTSEYNWNLVCNSGLVVGALAVADTDPEYARAIVPAAVASMPKAFGLYEPDGAYAEGPGYWNYATSYAVFGLAALQSALGTDFGLSAVKGFEQAAWFPLHGSGPTDMYFNYADAGEGARRQIPSLFWLARRYGNPVFAEVEREMIKARGGGGPHDLIWYVPPDGRPVPPIELDKHFRGKVEVACFRSAWKDPEALYVGIKAGFNQVNHGNLDLGSFVLDALGQRWARDLGGDNYNLPGYWDGKPKGKRWTYFRLGSHSHNVVTISGQNQDALAESRIVKFAPGLATVDLTAAYKPLARAALRGIQLIDNRRRVLVQDDLILDAPGEVVWGMTTGAEIAADGPRALLSQGKKQLVARIVSPAGASFETESAEQKPPQEPNKGVRRLLVRLKDQRGEVRVAVILAPAWPEGALETPPKLKPVQQW